MRIAQAGFKAGKDGRTPADLLAEHGPTFHVDVGLRSVTPIEANQPPDLPKKKILALIDTGAGLNGIDEELARALALPPIEEGHMSGFHGREPVTFYLTRVYVPQLNRVIFDRFAGAKLTQGGQSHKVILGRSFLRGCVMDYNAITGQVEIKEH